MAATTPRNYWMVAVHPGYYDASREAGFTVLGMGRAQKKRAQRMEIGDRVLYYVTELMVFAVAATVTGTYFEDATPIWPSPDPEETYAWRVKTRPDKVLNERERLDARLIAPRMEYVRRWTPEHWPLAFQGLLHLIPKKDFQFIEAEMHRKPRRPQPVVAPDPDAICVLDVMAAKG